MSKFHINKATGRANICRASVRDCPVGGEHYDSKEEASQAYEKQMSSQSMPVSVKKPAVATSEKIDRVSLSQEFPAASEQSFTEAQKAYDDAVNSGASAVSALGKARQVLEQSENTGQQNFKDTVKATKDFVRAPKNLPIVLREGMASPKDLWHLGEKELASFAMGTHVSKYHDELVSKSQGRVKRALIQNPYLSEANVSILATDDDVAVREWAAVHPSSTSLTVMMLTDDKESSVRQRCTDNVTLSHTAKRNVLEKLSQDEVVQVRASVAQDWDLPENVASFLAHDKDPLVRESLARNNAVAEFYPEITANLMQDSNETVAKEAKLSYELYSYEA